MISWLIGVIILVLDIWAIFQVFSSKAGFGGKILWALLIIILPVLGLIMCRSAASSVSAP